MYTPPLATAHALGFADLARGAVPALLDVLATGPRAPRRVFDLGCGAGQTTAALAAAGWDVVGVDVSDAMLARARATAPGATFWQASVYGVVFEPCVAVFAVGEPLTYHRPEDDAASRLRRLFQGVAAALVPGGTLMFDVIVAGSHDLSNAGRREGPGFRVEWETRDLGVRLERHIVSAALGAGGGWVESREIHHVAVFEPDRLVDELSVAGFESRLSAGYGAHAVAARRAVFRATRRAS